jgi:hypothetical protein
MKINYIKKGALDYILIKDLYNSEQLKDVNEEIKKLVLHCVPAEFNDVAIDEKTKKPLKNGESLWLNDFYFYNGNDSAILKNNKKIFNSETMKTFKEFNAHYGHFEMTNFNFTLFNLYCDQEHYKAHKDSSSLSAITFLKIGDFTGGDFVFPEYNEIISFEENSMVIFPGCVTHEAKPIQTINKKNYRISIVYFMNYKLN